MPPEVPRIWATGWAIVQGKRKTWSKWIKDLNVRPETIKLPEENIGKTLSEIHHSRILYDPTPRILEIKAKINKWDLIKRKRNREVEVFRILLQVKLAGLTTGLDVRINEERRGISVESKMMLCTEEKTH